MKNRMQDLDFEQTVAFDSVKDFEFTRKAAQKFRQVVSLDSFEDEDADVIFHYLYKEIFLILTYLLFALLCCLRFVLILLLLYL